MFDSFDLSYLAWMLIGFGLFMSGAAFFDWLRNRSRGGLLDDRTAAYITARPNLVDRVRFERLARRAGWQVSGQWSDKYQAYDDRGLQRLWLGFGWGISLAEHSKPDQSTTDPAAGLTVAADTFVRPFDSSHRRAVMEAAKTSSSGRSGLNVSPENLICRCFPQGRPDCAKAYGCRERLAANASVLS